MLLDRKNISRCPGCATKSRTSVRRSVRRRGGFTQPMVPTTQDGTCRSGKRTMDTASAGQHGRIAPCRGFSCQRPRVSSRGSDYALTRSEVQAAMLHDVQVWTPMISAWARRAYCAGLSPSQAQKRRVLACPVLARPTRFERVTFAFGGQASTSTITEQRI